MKRKVFKEKLSRRMSPGRLKGTVNTRIMSFNKQGMELVQVAILVAIAIALGIIFKTQITSFVNTTLDKLSSSGF